ncbi:MAG TPA: hypothetical protein VFP35_03985 [Candidatus Saccharimonadales bacterium]|nr:hypothetical protein [Candidatus Saccharimonadales bacterium]
MRTELLNQVKNTEKVDELIRGYDFVLSGNSQGSVNAVGLLASAPPSIRVSALGLAQEVGLEAQGWFTFRKNFMLHGSDHFKQYTAENPYNQYPNLGPDFGPLTLPTRLATRFSTHLGATVHGMRRGGDVQCILDTVREREIQDLAVTLATGDRDGVASAEWTKLAGKVLNASRLVVAKTVIWPGHYHPAMENLANAQTAFRSFAQ